MTHPTRAVVLCISTLFGACGGGGGTADAPTVDHFTATPASVCAGGNATLAWGFSGGTGVITPGDFTAPSDTGENSVTVAATTTFVLTVTSSSGLTTAQATVTALPLPAVVITAPTSIATGASTFTASVPARAGASYAWRVTSGNGSVSQGATTREATVSVTGTGALVLEATITDTATGCAGVATASVALPGAPAITSFTASSPSVCQGHSLELSYAFANGAGTIMPGPVVLADQAGRVTVTPDASTTYELTVSGTGAAATADATVTVLPNPDATITTSETVITGATEVPASVTDLAGATYAWTVTGGTLTGGDGTRAITFNAGSSGSVVVSVTVTDAASGCATTREATVAVVAPPPLITSFTATPTTLCPGDSTRFDYEFTNGVGVITPGSIALSGPSGFVTAPVAATTTYTLTAHGTAPDATAQVTVTTLPAPDATITAPAQALVGATGLTASVPAGATTYTWSITSGNGVITSGAGTPSITFDVTGATAGTLTLKVTVLDESSGCHTVRTFDVGIIEPPPVINSFSAQKESVCAGSTVRLDYDFAHGTGVITPGPINLAGTSGYVEVPVDGNTNFTLTVSGSGAPATAETAVAAIAAPTASITTAAQGIAGVPTQATGPTGAGLQYLWAVTTSNGRITAGQGTANATFIASAKGTLTLSLTVTDATGCSGTTTADVNVNHGCATPMLISTDWTQSPAVPVLTPSTNMVPVLAVNASGELWSRFEVQLAGSSSANYDISYNRVDLETGTVLGGPTGAARFLDTQASGTWVLDSKVAVDDAGDAVFVWLQSTGGVFAPYVRGYHAATNTLSDPHKLTASAKAWNQDVGVSVTMDAQTGKALIAWMQTATYPTSIPHTIEYDVATDTLSNEVIFRTSSTNNLAPDLMNLQLSTNSTLDGFAVWTEQEAATGAPSIYALRFQKGVPDRIVGGPSDGAPDVQTLVTGGVTNTTDLYNPNSLWPSSRLWRNRTVAVSEGGNAAVLWGVNNSSGATPNAAIYARRFVGGTWLARETVYTTKANWADWAIDDSGEVVAVLEFSTTQSVTHAAVGAAWSTPSLLNNSSNGGTSTFIAVDPVSGDGFIIYPGAGHLYGAFYDRATHGVSAGVQLDVTPGELYTYIANVIMDGTGRAVISFVQGHDMIHTMSANSYQWVTTCQ